jgi:hypothetical protein
MEVSGQPHDPAVLTPHPTDKGPRYPWSREPPKLHSQSGRFQKNLSSLPEFEPQIVQLVVALVYAVRSPSAGLPNPRILWTPILNDFNLFNNLTHCNVLIE